MLVHLNFYLPADKKLFIEHHICRYHFSMFFFLILFHFETRFVRDHKSIIRALTMRICFRCEKIVSVEEIIFFPALHRKRFSSDFGESSSHREAKAERFLLRNISKTPPTLHCHVIIIIYLFAYVNISRQLIALSLGEL